MGITKYRSSRALQHISCTSFVNSGFLNNIMWFKIFSEKVEGSRGSIRRELKANNAVKVKSDIIILLLL